MGILNVTPDSFYGASRSPGPEDAVRRGLSMVEEGADIIDVGGESTRPGSESIPIEEELRRILPVIEQLARRVRLPISVDTYKPEVARRALDAGATILNDVLALRGGDGMPGIASRFDAVVLMHMLGTSPRAMQDAPVYQDVVADILSFFGERLEVFERAGGDLSRVWLDPGIGFGKTVEHNLRILSDLERFKVPGRPLLIGVSRKSFLGRLARPEAPLPPEQRLEGSLAVACRAAQAGAAAVRVHDVGETVRTLEVWRRVQRPVQEGALA